MHPNRDEELLAKISHSDIYKTKAGKCNTPSDRQDDCTKLLAKDGGGVRGGGWGEGDSQCGTSKDIKINLELPFFKSNYDYCGISSKQLNSKVFKKITQIMGNPDMDLLASHLSHQIPGYMSWRPDPGSMATDALKQNWRNLFSYAFPHSA